MFAVKIVELAQDASGASFAPSKPFLDSHRVMAWTEILQRRISTVPRRGQYHKKIHFIGC